MLARNETIIKWALYAAVSLLGVFAQSAVLQRLDVFGVIPFLFPLLAAIPATFESSTAGTAFAKDECGWWGDDLYKSLIDANVWTPDAHGAGWELVTE